MKARNIQLATAAVSLVLIALIVTLVRAGYDEGEKHRETAEPVVQPKAKTAPVEIGTIANDGYAPNVALESASPKAAKKEDDDFSEEECQQFTQHVRDLKSKENPGNKSAYTTPEAMAGFDGMCEKKDVSMKFIRCALSKKSAKDFVQCQSGDEHSFK